MSVHVAEEARHISFANTYLRKRVPHMPRVSRFFLSHIFRSACGCSARRPCRRAASSREFDIPRSVRTEMFSGAATLIDAAQHVRRRPDAVLRRRVDIPLARLTWRVCRIGGRPSRYRGEPQREHPLPPVTPLSNRR